MIEKHKIEVIFFDAGNTLLNINYIYIQSVLESFNYSFSIEVIKKNEAIARKEMDEYYYTTKKQTELMSSFELYINKFLEKLGIKEARTNKNIINFLIQKHTKSNIYDYVPEDAKEILNYCYLKNYQMGVISNSRGDVAQLIKRCNLSKYFEHIVDSAEVGYEKPDKRIFEYALNLFKCESKDCIYIGDMFYIDVIGAKNVGILPILLDRFNLYNDVDCLKISNLIQLKNFL